MNKIALKEFVLPVVIDRDSDYLDKLQSVLDTYLQTIKNQVPSQIHDKTKDNIDKILSAVRHYFSADISKAKQGIFEILDPYTTDPYIVAELDKSTAFRGWQQLRKNQQDFVYSDIAYHPIRMYKARVGIGNFEKSDFLHIPFTKRGNVSTQRFSIAGVPCMYFGFTSYVCWLELGKPADSEFNVAAYDMPKYMKVLNLAIPQMMINGLSNYDDMIPHVSYMVELFPLIIATSFKVKEAGRSFKSEYIVSQLVMQCLTDLNIDSVAYVSKQVKNDSSSYPFCINLAVPMKSNPNNENYSDFSLAILFTNPINYAEYKQLIYPEKAAGGNVMSFATLYELPIHYMDKRIPYSNLNFSKLDDYLYNEDFDILK